MVHNPFPTLWPQAPVPQPSEHAFACTGSHSGAALAVRVAKNTSDSPQLHGSACLLGSYEFERVLFRKLFRFSIRAEVFFAIQVSVGNGVTVAKYLVQRIYLEHASKHL